MDFPDIYAELTGKDVIGGKIALSETGDLSFQENNRSFPLPVTATGVTNLGMLALLIERKVLNKGTFLFMDEPEAHLHPSWQIFMVKNLFDLSRQGANVVITTHSVDILKCKYWVNITLADKPTKNCYAYCMDGESPCPNEKMEQLRYGTPAAPSEMPSS